MKPQGRPRTSKLPRSEQLRRAKLKQRARQRSAGLVNIQLTLPEPLAKKLAVVRESGQLVEFLSDALANAVICIADYPALADLAWNRTDTLIPAKEAFSLYECNWRHVQTDKLSAAEAQLIERLAREYGGGVIHA